MKERPILFSGPMVRAILEGRKTQTRRIIKQAVLTRTMEFATAVCPAREGGWVAWFDGVGQEAAEFTKLAYDYGFRCPYGEPGDRLWVRETWAVIWTEDDPDWEEGQTVLDVPHRVEYKADTGAKYPGEWPDDKGSDPDCPRWRPSIHMPRWASRLTLEVIDVRVQRVAEISEEDVLAEGFAGADLEQYGPYWRPFQLLWDSLNARRGYPWAVNPWVWAITFRVTGGSPVQVHGLRASLERGETS